MKVPQNNKSIVHVKTQLHTYIVPTFRLYNHHAFIIIMYTLYTIGDNRYRLIVPQPTETGWIINNYYFYFVITHLSSHAQ